MYHIGLITLRDGAAGTGGVALPTLEVRMTMIERKNERISPEKGGPPNLASQTCAEHMKDEVMIQRLIKLR